MTTGSVSKFSGLLLIGIITVAVFLVDGHATKAISEDDKEELVNYAFATWLGSGIYKSGARRMAIVRMPLRYTLRIPEEAKPGIKFLMPVTLGYYDYKNSDVDFGTGSFVPGVEVAFSLNEYWTLKPFGQFGVGKDTSDGNLVYIYGGGIRSLVSIPYKKFKFGIGNSLILADERDGNGDIGDNFNMFEAGLDIQHPLGISFRGRKLDGGVYFVISRFLSRYELEEPDDNSRKLKTLVEIGFTIAPDEPIDIWKVSLERIGIDFRFGDHFAGIGMNMGFPF